MKYWDSSAVLPLLLDEKQTPATRRVYEEDPAQTVWCLTDVEIGAALSRRVREGLTEDRVERVRDDWGVLARRWRPIASLDAVSSRALRLVRTHPLRAADALQPVSDSRNDLDGMALHYVDRTRPGLFQKRGDGNIQQGRIQRQQPVGFLSKPR